MTLSPREVEVLHLAANGATLYETASVLHLSADTVKTHRRNALRKLGARNIPQAVAVGFRKGVLS